MTKFWSLIAVVIFLTHQVPTSRSQNPNDNCPTYMPECQCGNSGLQANCTLTSPQLPNFGDGIYYIYELRLTCNPGINLQPQRLMFGATQLHYLRLLSIHGCFNQPLVPGIFFNLNTLINLTLDGNQILTLGPRIFNDTTALQNLRLSNNGISSIEPGTFDNMMEVLKELALDNNQLVALNISVFQSITSITNVNFSGNPLVCDCRLVDIWLRFSMYNQNTRCPTGNDLGGRTWSELNEAVLRQHGDCGGATSPTTTTSTTTPSNVPTTSPTTSTTTTTTTSTTTPSTVPTTLPTTASTSTTTTSTITPPTVPIPTIVPPTTVSSTVSTPTTSTASSTASAPTISTSSSTASAPTTTISTNDSTPTTTTTTQSTATSNTSEVTTVPNNLSPTGSVSNIGLIIIVVIALFIATFACGFFITQVNSVFGFNSTVDADRSRGTLTKEQCDLKTPAAKIGNEDEVSPSQAAKVEGKEVVLNPSQEETIRSGEI